MCWMNAQSTRTVAAYRPLLSTRTRRFLLFKKPYARSSRYLSRKPVRVAVQLQTLDASNYACHADDLFVCFSPRERRSTERPRGIPRTIESITSVFVAVCYRLLCTSTTRRIDHGERNPIKTRHMAKLRRPTNSSKGPFHASCPLAGCLPSNALRCGMRKLVLRCKELLGIHL